MSKFSIGCIDVMAVLVTIDVMAALRILTQCSGMIKEGGGCNLIGPRQIQEIGLKKVLQKRMPLSITYEQRRVKRISYML